MRAILFKNIQKQDILVPFLNGSRFLNVIPQLKCQPLKIWTSSFSPKYFARLYFFHKFKNSRKIPKLCRLRSGSTTRPNLVGLKRPNWRLTQIGSEMWHGPRHLENREQSLLAAPKTEGLLSGRQNLDYISLKKWFILPESHSHMGEFLEIHVLQRN